MVAVSRRTSSAFHTQRPWIEFLWSVLDICIANTLAIESTCLVLATLAIIERVSLLECFRRFLLHVNNRLVSKRNAALFE